MTTTTTTTTTMEEMCLDIDELNEDFKLDEKNNKETQAIYTFDREEHTKLLISNLERMRNKTILTNLEISNNQRKSYGLHSALLSAASQHFRQFFSETKICFHSGRLDVGDVKTNVLEALLKYLYQPHEVFDVSSWDELMEFASRFGFSRMVDGKGNLSGYLTNLRDMRDNLHMTYTVLQTENDEYFSCHDCVIAASSPEMCRMIAKENSKSNSGRLDIILPGGICGPAVSAVLDYVYGAQLSVTVDNVEAVLSASSLLRYPSMGRACVDFILRRLDQTRALQFQIFSAERLKKMRSEYLENLNMETKRYICDNFCDVLTSAAFAMRSSEEDILRYLASSDLSRISLDGLIAGLLRWRAAETGRDQAFAKLIALSYYLFRGEELKRDIQEILEAQQLLMQQREGGKGNEREQTNRK